MANIGKKHFISKPNQTSGFIALNCTFIWTDDNDRQEKIKIYVLTIVLTC